MEINEISYRILNTSTNFPKALKLNQRLITDKVDIVNTFNSHFISASSITDNSLVIDEQGTDELTNSESDLFSFAPVLPFINYS